MPEPPPATRPAFKWAAWGAAWALGLLLMLGAAVAAMPVYLSDTLRWMIYFGCTAAGAVLLGGCIWKAVRHRTLSLLCMLLVLPTLWLLALIIWGVVSMETFGLDGIQ